MYLYANEIKVVVTNSNSLPHSPRITKLILFGMRFIIIIYNFDRNIYDMICSDFYRFFPPIQI